MTHNTASNKAQTSKSNKYRGPKKNIKKIKHAAHTHTHTPNNTSMISFGAILVFRCLSRQAACHISSRKSMCLSLHQFSILFCLSPKHSLPVEQWTAVTIDKHQLEPNERVRLLCLKLESPYAVEDLHNLSYINSLIV